MSPADPNPPSALSSLSPQNDDEGIDRPAGGEKHTKSLKRRALGNLRRDLTEEELANKGVMKLILDSIDDLEEDNSRLQDYCEKFHAVDKKLAVSEEKEKKSMAGEVASGVAFAIGGLLAGAAFSVSQGTVQLLLSISGIALIIGGTTVKAVLR